MKASVQACLQLIFREDVVSRTRLVCCRNYSPCLSWNMGASCVALNWQYWDKAMWINEGKVNFMILSSRFLSPNKPVFLIPVQGQWELWLRAQAGLDVIAKRRHPSQDSPNA